MKTQEEIMELLDEEVKKAKEIISQSESDLDALEYFIFELVTNVPDEMTHYEIVGLLEEVKLRWREVSKEALEEELPENQRLN